MTFRTLASNLHSALCCYCLSQCSFAQVVSGKFIDCATNDPIGFVNVHGHSSKPELFGVVADSTGWFELDTQGVDTLAISFIGYGKHLLIGVASSGTTNLGDIPLMYMGSVRYVQYAKRKLFSKRTSRHCQMVDDRRVIKPDDLIVRCSDGSIRFSWQLFAEGVLSSDIREHRPCPSR